MKIRAVATGSKVEYQWNHANLLTGVIYKTSNNVVTESVAYQYDALGRRIGKSVDDNGNGTVDRRESYIYDGAGLLSSFSPTGGEGGRRPDEGASAIHISGPNGSLGQHGWTDQMVLSFVDADGDGSATSQLSGRYLYGPAVDEIFAVENGTGDVLWALTDQLGTPRDWAQRTSSGNTVIAQHIRYTAFGAIDSITDGAGNPLASGSSPLASFTGQLNDPDAGLIYYRARWYDPQLGKFISDDPMGFDAGDVNVSRYLGNASPTLRDPTGLFDDKDREHLINLAKGNPGALAELEKLFKAMNDAKRLTPDVDDTGPCGTFAQQLYVELLKQFPFRSSEQGSALPRTEYLTWEKEYYTVEPPRLSVDYHQMYTMTLALPGKDPFVFYVDAGTHLGGDRTGNLGGTDQVFIGNLDDLYPHLVPSDGMPTEDVPYVTKFLNSTVFWLLDVDGPLGRDGDPSGGYVP